MLNTTRDIMTIPFPAPVYAALGFLRVAFAALEEITNMPPLQKCQCSAAEGDEQSTPCLCGWREEFREEMGHVAYIVRQACASIECQVCQLPREFLDLLAMLDKSRAVAWPSAQEIAKLFTPK